MKIDLAKSATAISFAFVAIFAPSTLLAQGASTTPDYFKSLWAGLAPEQKFGSFVESFWAFSRSSTGAVDCPPGVGQPIKGCLAKFGYRFDSAYPAECRVNFTEFAPAPANLEKTWDGKVVGKYTVARSLSIDLHGLRPSLINNSLRLYFDAKKTDSVTRAVALSTDPTTFITLPPPPTLSDVSPSPNDADRLMELKRLMIAWGQGVIQSVGNANNLPYFAYFNAFGENTSAGPELGDLNNLFYTLSPPNRMQPVQLFSRVEEQEANALFVDAIKSVIAKCPNQ